MEPVKLSLKMADWSGVHGEHPTLTSTLTGDQRFCAYSHCIGECGFPALFLRYAEPDGEPVEYKAHGSMVACGPVWQRKSWKGDRVYLPERYQTEQTFKMWWW